MVVYNQMQVATMLHYGIVPMHITLWYSTNSVMLWHGTDTCHIAWLHDTIVTLNTQYQYHTIAWNQCMMSHYDKVLCISLWHMAPMLYHCTYTEFGILRHGTYGMPHHACHTMELHQYMSYYDMAQYHACHLQHGINVCHTMAWYHTMAQYQCISHYGTTPMHIMLRDDTNACHTMIPMHIYHTIAWYQCMSHYDMVPMHDIVSMHVTLWHGTTACHTMA